MPAGEGHSFGFVFFVRSRLAADTPGNPKTKNETADSGPVHPVREKSSMSETRTITLDSRDEALLLFGQRDAYLRMIRDALVVRLIARGDTVTIEGDEEPVGQAERVFQQLRSLLKQQGQIQ